MNVYFLIFMKLPFEEIKRKTIIKNKSETDEKYGLKPEKRTTKDIIEYGVVNIDKPSGPCSHQISDYVQKILKINKAGHSGTLDPKVTGVLPIALGRATRVVEYLLKAGKEYIALMHLHKEVDEKEIKKVFKEFTGKIKQLPPIKSAVKREERTRTIYYIEILEIDKQDVLFKVGCEAGTYIRKLIHDIGQKLKVGAHMSELRRTKAGPFDESTLFTLQDLTDAFYYYNNGDDTYLRKIIQPVENAVRHLPKIYVIDSAINSICHGVDLKAPGISKFESEIKIDDDVAVFSLKNELIAVGKACFNSETIKKLEKGLVVRVNKVFMDSKTYPRLNDKI